MERTDRLRQNRGSTAGFTLVEVMIAAGLSAILLAALLSSVVFFTKSGIAMDNYFEMETQSRHMLEVFSRDVREAENATWNNTDTVTLLIDGSSIVYTYDSDEDTFTRTSSGAHGPIDDVLVRSLQSFEFFAYDKDGAILNLVALPSVTTKMIQVSMSLEREVGAGAGPANTLNIVSTRLLLRNKPIPAP